MYQDLRQNFWWTRMKKEIAKYVAECDTCQRVKASHLKVAGTLQPLPILSWKWDDINMNFIVGLPNTGLLLIDSQKQPTSFQCSPPIRPTNMRRFILIASFDCMVYQRRLFLIVVLSLLHVFRNNSKKLLEPI